MTEKSNVLSPDFVSKVLDILSDSSVEYDIEVDFDDQIYPTYRKISDLYGKTDINALEIKLRLDFTNDFETRVYGEYVKEQYEEIKSLNWSFHRIIEIEITAEHAPEFNFEVWESLLEDIQSVNEYFDLDFIPTYYDARQDEIDTAVKDHGLWDFARSLISYVETLYPLADVSDLIDYTDTKWFKSLFWELMEYEEISDNHVMFTFKDFYAPDNEALIIGALETHLDDMIFVPELSYEAPHEKLLNLGDKLLFEVLPLNDFTLSQVSNVLWLQENKTWSNDNLIFISGYGFYVLVNQYSHSIVNSLTSNPDQVLSLEHLRQLVKELSKSDSSWHANWRETVYTIAELPGCEKITQHYKHGDIYDTTARKVFNELIVCYPHLATLTNNWYSLLVNTDLKPKKYQFVYDDSHTRYNRPLNEFQIRFDVKQAIYDQAKNFDSFLLSLKRFVESHLNPITYK